MRIGIVSHYVRDSDGDTAKERVDLSEEVVTRIAEFLDGEGIEYTFNKGTGRALGSEDAVAIDQMDADVIVTVGGDGTILRTIRQLRDPVPVLGINTGRVGFLAHVDPTDAVEAVAEVLEGFETESRARLGIELNGTKLPPGLNETVIVTSRPAKIMEFDVYHAGEHVESVRSDGIVAATPTGSTAYSMSAGGPLVDPSVEAFLVVPLAPFRMNTVPWVLDSEDETVIEPRRAEREGAVVIDGSHITNIEPGDEIRFTRAEKDALFVKTEKTFFDNVREKLL
ncbi:MAG: NAD(+)/NADH kinase [Halobacteria archaeon]|nr:NAD(+)/NADH kinase [Halobacteria archaeon]